ncbi:hypothetical protein WKV44_08305 [Spirochaetia bacterium 38H-sp]|uniref:Uncharacterized protein n=1 Tax=Rarispira pelagica TaxID=3141764 RepID=A0ABU9UD08_9SPIR
MELIEGHYAHYDVVSYEDLTTPLPMRTFIVSYGFTDFYIKDDKLYQKDRFIHAKQILNQHFTTSQMSDLSTSAIESKETEVKLRYTDGKWIIYRPATPTLIGIDRDPELPLPAVKDGLIFTDPDNDGKPGVTVALNISGLIKAEIYIARREIFQYYITVYSRDFLSGYVNDLSEQIIIGASHTFLAVPSNNTQHPDPSMNPIILRRVSKSIDTWEELQAVRDELFPPEPAF